MSASNPRREAYRILRRVEEGGAFASVLLEQRAASLTDPRDASLLTEIVLGVLRKRAALDFAIARAAARPFAEIEPAVAAALRIGAYSLLELDRVPDFAAVDTAVSLVREGGRAKAAGFVNGVLRTIAREGESLRPPEPSPGDVEALALARSHPAWWTRRVVDRLGWSRAVALLTADNVPPRVVLATPPGAGALDELRAELAEAGVTTEPCGDVPGALRVVVGSPQRTEAFRRGAFWIQDEASQLAVALFGPSVGPWSADVCAAPGSKTLALAVRTPPGGRVVAVDRRAKRLLRVLDNVRRVGVQGVHVVAADMTKPAPFARPFDDVLVDAPCSGTGTLRRHPEIRWRLHPEDLSDLAARQRRLLDVAAAIVRPGGRLVYSVCSLEPEEGDDVVASFLAEHAEFTRADPRPALAAPASRRVGDDLALRTTPAESEMDGFYAALLKKRGD